MDRSIRGINRQTKVGWSLTVVPTLYVFALIGLSLALAATYSVWSQSLLQLDRIPTLENYRRIFSQPIYRTLILRSLFISGTATVLTVVLAYPVAYFISFYGRNYKALILIIVTVPFWTSYLLRVLSWKLILGTYGPLNTALIWLGAIDAPLKSFMYNMNSVILALTHAWAPFSIFPIFVALERIDRSLLEVAKDLGQGTLARFFRVVLPLSMPGVIGASLLVFMPTVGDYITPSLVGGSSGRMVANIIEAQFGALDDWPMGAALALITMACAIIVATIYVILLRILTKRIR